MSKLVGVLELRGVFENINKSLSGCAGVGELRVGECGGVSGDRGSVVFDVLPVEL